MKKILFISLFAGMLLAACSSDDPGGSGLQENRKIELSFSTPAYNLEVTNGNTRAVATRATDAGTTDEQQINNLYVFLFPTTGAPVRYEMSADGAFTGGTWSKADKKVTLDLTQAEAGSREVYVVANYDADLKTKLDAVTTTAGLKAVLRTTASPWSGNLTTPILMSGTASHNFITNYKLETVSLIRAVAKLQLNITLSTVRQSTSTIEQGISGSTTTVYQYKYKLLNFDKDTYVLKPTSKPDNLASSTDWVNWDAAGALTQYKLTDGNVTTLTLTTYLNERDNAGTEIALSLPYISSGTLPPPEFGDETYKLTLPATIVRNTMYIYNVEI